jgi:hypothetical protein
VACDFTTGNLLADLPDLTMQSPLRQTLCQYEQNTLSLPISTAPTDWLYLTRPEAVNLIALDENNMPVWGGPIVQRSRSEGDQVTLSVSTGEGYFDRRFISPAVSSTVITTADYGYYSAWDQCQLAADLVTRYAQTGTKPGMPLRVVWTPSAQPGRTHIYSDSDDKTLYSGLQDLSSILNGPEWTITWEWQHNPERITPVFSVADRLGRAVNAGMLPNAAFYMPGSVISVTVLEDYSSGKGANDITAVGAGQGNSRPSARQVATNFGGRPTIEYRFNVPAVGQLTVAQIAALGVYAGQALTFMGAGAQSVTLTSTIEGAPVLGQDWNLGDDIGYQIGGLDGNGVDLVPAFPGGFSGVARTVALERTDTTIAPILWVPDPTLTAGSF